jgi:hypothetical protein
MILPLVVNSEQVDEAVTVWAESVRAAQEG